MVALQPVQAPRSWPLTHAESEAAGEMALIEATYERGSYVAIVHEEQGRLRAAQAMAGHAIPQHSVHTDVRLDDLYRALERMNAGPASAGARVLRLTVTDLLVKAMGLTGVSKSQVSRLCEDIDGKVKAFLERHPGFEVLDVRDLVPARLGAETGQQLLAAARVAPEGLTLSPHRTGTDSFFVSILRRTSG